MGTLELILLLFGLLNGVGSCLYSLVCMSSIQADERGFKCHDETHTARI